VQGGGEVAVGLPVAHLVQIAVPGLAAGGAEVGRIDVEQHLIGAAVPGDQIERWPAFQ
jgi:hypothetical protein